MSSGPTRTWWLWYAATVLAGGALIYSHSYSHTNSLLDLNIGQIDSILTLAWFGLLLLPLISEFKIGGIALKSAVATLQRDQEMGFKGLREQIQNVISIQSQNQNHLIFNLPNDRVLRRRKAVLARTLPSRDKSKEEPMPKNPEDFGPRLAAISRQIGGHLYRLAGKPVGDVVIAPEALIPELIESQVLPETTAEAIKTILTISRSYLFGSEVTDAQIDYVAEIAPPLLSVLEVTEGHEHPHVA